MGKFMQFMIAIAVLCGVLTFAGLGYVVYKGAEMAGAGSDVIQKEGIKGLAVRLWCGSHGCK